MPYFVIATKQNPELPETEYFWTGDLSGKSYPPVWSWRKDMALLFPTNHIAEQWMNKLHTEGIKSNDGERVSSFYIKET